MTPSVDVPTGGIVFVFIVVTDALPVPVINPRARGVPPAPWSRSRAPSCPTRSPARPGW